MHQQRTPKQYMYVQSAENIIVDPDLNKIRMRTNLLGKWFRIRKGKKDPQKREKSKEFNVLKCWVFFLED
jgi:hypothetical protein